VIPKIPIAVSYCCRFFVWSLFQEMELLMTILELVWGAIWFFPEKIYERFGKLGCFIFFSANIYWDWSNDY